jgi:lipoate-protein ligase A
MDTAEFLQRLYAFYRQRFPDAVPYELTAADQAAIRKLADEKYSAWEWNYGASPAFAVSASRKYDFGLVDVRLNVVHGHIKDIRIFGDYFGVRSISELETLLAGTEYRRESITGALSCVALEDYISGMTAEKLAQLIAAGV